MRRLLQAQGAEVIHLGHDRSVEEIVDAARPGGRRTPSRVSSYQGGHMEFFRYLVERLRARGAGHIRVYGGGGGMIAPDEIARARTRAASRASSAPRTAARLGLEGMIRQIARRVARSGRARRRRGRARAARADATGRGRAARSAGSRSTARDGERRGRARCARALARAGAARAGAGRRLHRHRRRGQVERRRRGRAPLAPRPSRRSRSACLLVDPTRRRTRRRAARRSHPHERDPRRRQSSCARSRRAARTSRSRAPCATRVRVLQAAGFDLVLVETAGIGQSDSEIVDLADVSVYVMTPEYGAPSQLEKIDMLELADLVVLNKCDRHGAEDALRDVRKQWRRNHADARPRPTTRCRSSPTIASRLERSRARIASTRALRRRALARARARRRRAPCAAPPRRPPSAPLVPAARAPLPRRDRRDACAATARAAEPTAERASRRLGAGRARCARSATPPAAHAARSRARRRRAEPERSRCAALRRALAALAPTRARRSRAGPTTARALRRPTTQSYEVRGRAIPVANHVETLSGTAAPAVALPRARRAGASSLRYLAPREPARALPVHRGRLPVQARGRGSDAHVRGRGHARAHQPPLPPARARAAGARASRPPSTA